MELLKLQDAFHCAVGWSLDCVHRLGCAALGRRAKVNWSSLLREAVLAQVSVSLPSQTGACARVPSTPGLLLPWLGCGFGRMKWFVLALPAPIFGKR